MNRKPFIFILGVPSGGTSCVAEIIKRLGIDMGIIPNGNGPLGRNYSTVEDGRFFDEVVNLHCSWGRPVPQSTPAITADAVARYVEHRRQAKSSAPSLACKGWVNWATTDSSFWRIPNMSVIRVYRPLEDCLTSFISYQKRAPQNSRKDLARLSAYIAGLWCMAFQLQPPESHVLELSYADLIEDPYTAISRITEELPLETSVQEIENAIKHVRQSDRNLRFQLNAAML